jgi:hypothetical protein
MSDSPFFDTTKIICWTNVLGIIIILNRITNYELKITGSELVRMSTEVMSSEFRSYELGVMLVILITIKTIQQSNI